MIGRKVVIGNQIDHPTPGSIDRHRHTFEVIDGQRRADPGDLVANKLRGAIRRGQVSIADVVTARDAGGYALTAEQLVKPRRAAKAEEPVEA